VADPKFQSQRTRILVIEDNRADRVLLMQRLGHITETLRSDFAETLAEAGRMRDRHWDVLLLDLHLPGSRGLETLERARELFPETPIIVLTGLKDESLGAQAMQAGAQDYLVKSDYNAAILERTIRHSKERFKLLKDLSAQRSRLNDILEHTSEGIVAVNASEEVVFANRAALEILGESLADLQGKPWGLNLLNPDPFRHSIEHPDRGEVIVEVRTTRTGALAERLFLCSLRDITEEARLQIGLIEREKMAAVGELSSGIAHEFNNLLAAVQANIELMMLRDPADELGQNILTALDRGKTLVQDLMTFNPHKAPLKGRTHLAKYFSANQAVIDKLLGPGIQFVVGEALPEWAVSMGPGMLNQVVINLAVNARDAMKDGGTFSIHFSQEPFPDHLEPGSNNDRERDWVRISFTDTGCGMSEAVRARVFDAFFTTKGRKGNGLGLTAVYNLVRDGGGDIEVESTLGMGTSFHVWLPSYALETSEPSDHGPIDLSAEEEPIRVLFVEDEDLLRMAMCSYLDTRGYDVTSVSDGQAALDAIELTTKPFDAVVSDQVMPRLNGTDFIERAVPLLPSAAFILTSAYEIRMIGKDWPLFDRVRFLPKPYHGHELHDLIIKQMSRSRQTARPVPRS
jgi:two-component system, cell cycle sensor histidine kinase and response regulator CckA